MSAARRGAIAATVLLVGLVALVLSPGASRAESVPVASSIPLAPAKPSPSPSPAPTCSTSVVNIARCTVSTTLSVTSETTTTAATTTTTLTYAVLPGNVSIPPTATPKPAPTPTPSPAATTDIGASALGSDTAATTSQAVRATTVINPQPGGDSSSVLPLTVLAFLVLVGGGAIVLVTRLR
ncbi:MAG: hypothetical protein QOE72_31 [Chloroflexota bacterium]|jgi:hypothetical protein|nr:hypothetical protein [Chloroflexota bacterium]